MTNLGRSLIQLGGRTPLGNCRWLPLLFMTLYEDEHKYINLYMRDNILLPREYLDNFDMIESFINESMVPASERDTQWT